ncbi:hypothetical protein ACIQZI_15480 [Peribacillus sp. NPDC096379]|uniref:hypothetical protein n=1 Tax=Peribacillus sp. NPDC096379 TaxID=3364393 RepID=UPI0038233AA6
MTLVMRGSVNLPEKVLKKNIKILAPDDDFESSIRLRSKHHFKKIPVVMKQAGM